MPIYVYQCNQCLESFELKQDFDSALYEKCPNCHGLANRKMSSFSFSLIHPGGKSKANPNSRRVTV